MSELIKDDDFSNTSGNAHILDLCDQVTQAGVDRRSFMKAGAGVGLMGAMGVSLSACGGGGGGSDDVVVEPGRISFSAISTNSLDTVTVPEGYVADVLYRWGDPCVAGAPAFRGDASERALEQEMQAGDNHDGINLFPFPGEDGNTRALIAMNHEYINPEYIFEPRGANWYAPLDRGMVDKMVAAHGVSVIEVAKAADGSWSVVPGSPYNRRITGYTPIEITGPAAGEDRLKTAADATGTRVLGTLNNCGAGQTPWGTYLTCEENFNGYFGTEDATWAPDALQSRYGVSAGGFGYLWHTADPRFDLAQNPNEPNRFGWVVEIDPFAPASTPKKRTAMGRFKHENAEFALAADNRAVVYMGDDERFDYLYKFVSARTYDPANPATGIDILDSGTLYVARFDAGETTGDNAGTGVWLPLVFGQNGLTPENGFTSQADVLIRTRVAADFVGATKMDRPEWIAYNNQKKGEVYVCCTNNSRRTAAQIDDVNPRASNQWGHIVRWNEAGADAAATSFVWDLFVVAGNPSLEGDKRGSANVTEENKFNSPDGLQFDPEGRLWIQTDGAKSNEGNFVGMGNNQMLVADVATGEIRRILVGPAGCEVTGITWSPDGRAAFLNIQHPGEAGGHPNTPSFDANAFGSLDEFINNNPTAFSTWPDGASAGRPRSATIVLRRLDGGVVGT